jgi:hypothetical protein
MILCASFMKVTTSSHRSGGRWRRAGLIGPVWIGVDSIASARWRCPYCMSSSWKPETASPGPVHFHRMETLMWRRRRLSSLQKSRTRSEPDMLFLYVGGANTLWVCICRSWASHRRARLFPTTELYIGAIMLMCGAEEYCINLAFISAAGSRTASSNGTSIVSRWFSEIGKLLENYGSLNLYSLPRVIRAHIFWREMATTYATLPYFTW